MWFQFGEQQRRKRGVQSRFLCWERAGETGYRGTQQTTGLMVRYKVIKVSWLLSGEDLVG